MGLEIVPGGVCRLSKGVYSETFKFFIEERPKLCPGCHPESRESLVSQTFQKLSIVVLWLNVYNTCDLNLMLILSPNLLDKTLKIFYSISIPL